MKDLLELIDVVNKHKIKHIEVLGNPPPRKTLVQEFYDKLCEGSFASDEAAAAYFYQSTPNDRRYKVLKRRLIQRLHNTVLFIDVQQSKLDKIGKAYYSCWKEYATAKVLAGRSAISNAYPLLEKVLKQALQYEFTELILDISRLLRLHYGTHNLNPKRFNYYNDLFKTYKERFEADVLAEEFYAIISMGFYGMTNQKQEEVYKQAQDYIQQLQPLVDRFDSYKLNLFFYLIKLTAANCLNKTEDAILVCEQALIFFQSRDKFSVRSIAIFSRQLFILYWQNRAFEKGEELLTLAGKYTIIGSIGWFVNYDYFFLLCMHTKQYQKAYKTLRFVLDHSRFNSLPDYDQERWKIYEAYIAYLGGVGKIEMEERKRFKVNKFLNEVPIFSSDKRSRNIPILIIQILFLLLYKRYDIAIDRMEAIGLYCKRYLKKDATFRSDCFIKMLLKIIEADFHKVGSIRKTAALSKKLDSVPLEVAKQVYETEIIPYEDLWEFALESLEHKFWKN